MQYKSLLFSLFFTIFSTTCSKREAPVQQRALPCLAISFDEKEMEKLKNSSKKRNKFDVPNAEFTLFYNEKHERGVVYHNDHIFRLKISKEQFSKIANIQNDGYSIAQLEPNQEHVLENPLYVATETECSYMAYKVRVLKINTPSKIEEAGYASDREAQSSKHMRAIEERNFIICTLGLGIPLGMLMFATGMLLWARFALYMFAESK